MRPPGRGVVVHSVTIAALWSMVAALGAALIVLVAGPVAAAMVAWLASSGRASLADTAMIWRAAGAIAWIVAVLAIGLAVSLGCCRTGEVGGYGMGPLGEADQPAFRRVVLPPNAPLA